MSLFRFFDAEKAVTFAGTIVDEYSKVHTLVDSSKKHAGRKEDRTLTLIRKAAAFAQGEKLNFYVRAKMLSTIKGGLIDAGIESGVANEFVRAIAVEALRGPRG
jgi:hypothetical protein